MFIRMIRVLVAALCLVGIAGEAFAEDQAEISEKDAVQTKTYPQLGHTSGVHTVAFSPDGRSLVSGSDDNTIKLWDVSNGREIRTLKGHGEVVRSVAFSPDSHSVATGNSDGTLKLWDVVSGRELRTLSGHSEAVRSVAFSPDGRSLISGSDDKTVKLWDVSNGREIRTLKGHGEAVSAVVFSPDGKIVASGSYDGTLKLWDEANGKVVRTIKVNMDLPQAVVFSPNGRTIVWCGDNYIKLWDAASGRELRTLNGLNAVAFSPDGQRIVSGGDLNTLMLWNAVSGKKIKTLSHNGFVRAVAFSPDGLNLVSGSSDSTIKLWGTSSGKVLRILSGHNNTIRAVTLSPDGRSIVTGGGGGYSNGAPLKFWDAERGQELHTIRGRLAGVDAVAFSPNNQLFVSGSDDSTLTLWNATSGKELRRLSGDSSAGVNAVAFSPDDQTIVSGGGSGGANLNDFTLKLWDVASGKKLRIFSGHSEAVRSVAFSPDGQRIASGSEDKTIKLWDISNGRELHTLIGHAADVNAVAFSPDGRVIVSGSSDKTIKLWDVANGRVLRTLKGHGNSVLSVAFSPDGLSIISGSDDASIKLWDTASGRELRTLNGHAGAINSVAVFPDGGNIISGSSDGTIRKWDVKTGKEIAQFVSFDDGEWVTITSEGYYASSNFGQKYLNIRMGDKVYGIDQFYDVFYRPDIVQAKLRGDDISGLITITVDQALKNPPPTLSFTKIPSSTSNNIEQVCYKAVATGGGIGEVRLFQNGKLIKSDGFYRETIDKTTDVNIKLASMDSAAVTRALKLTKTTQKNEPPMVSNSKGNEYSECQDIETIPGDNEISVAAFNANNTIQSQLETSHFTSGRKPEDSHLYVLGIGINKYQSVENNLSYAVKDATDFRAMIQAKAEGLFNASNIHIEGLNDADATKAGIQQAIQAISAKVKPWDSFILFVASHGYLQDNQYYIVTADFDGSVNTDKMISSNEIVGMSKNIKALSQLLIFDTCHAGGVDNIIGGLYDARMSVMANKMGLHIYASAGSAQTALDGYKGNGLFTHALLNSMNAGSVTDINHDKNVSVAELGAKAKQETVDISTQLGFPQSPNIINFGKDNTLFREQ